MMKSGVSDGLYGEAIEFDMNDPLRDFHAHFDLPADIIYLDGNSLGALPRSTRSKIDHAIQVQWGSRLVQSWNDSWLELPSRIAAKIARLIGADPDEVLICDSTTVNFFKLASAGLERQRGRARVLTEEMGFPTNSYVLQGLVSPSDLVTAKAPDQIHIFPEIVEAELNTEVGLMCLNHVNYRSGWLHDMKRLNSSAKKVGAINLWDLSHSVGVVPIDVHEAGADLAVGCTYKYLNGGPGAPAFLYVRKSLQQELKSPIQGWFGTQDFFDFSDRYQPASGITRFNAGTPQILSLLGVEAGVDLVLDAGIERIRSKSIALTDFLVEVYREKLSHLDVRLNSPTDSVHRGSHISLGHDRAFEIDAALIERMGVIPDFRKPDNIRFGLSPLYNKFTDVYESLDRMRLILENKSYELLDKTIRIVT